MSYQQKTTRSSTMSYHSRNPFALLQQDITTAKQHANQITQHSRASFNTLPFKRTEFSNNLPFTKYQIKPADKKQQRKQQAPSSKPKSTVDSPKKEQSQEKQSNKDQTKQLNEQQNDGDKKEVISTVTKLQQFYDDEDDDDQDEYQQRKYFLKKKQRDIHHVLDTNGDPPLLYDIGLQPEVIKDKIKLVLKLGQPDYDMIMNPDLSGPILIAFTFGFILLLSGQLHFGDIYALFLFGNIFLYVLFNFMTRSGMISLYNIMSIVGYCMLPMLGLGIFGIIFRLHNFVGMVMSLGSFLFIITYQTGASGWSSKAAANFLNALLRGKRDRNLLIMYPLFLFYLCFAMMVTF